MTFLNCISHVMWCVKMPCHKTALKTQFRDWNKSCEYWRQKANQDVENSVCSYSSPICYAGVLACRILHIYFDVAAISKSCSWVPRFILLKRQSVSIYMVGLHTTPIHLTMQEAFWWQPSHWERHLFKCLCLFWGIKFGKILPSVFPITLYLQVQGRWCMLCMRHAWRYDGT